METFCTKLSKIKDKDLQTRRYKKRLKEYKEEPHKRITKSNQCYIVHKDLMTELEPDILEREVKWASENTAYNKVTGQNCLKPYKIIPLKHCIFL